MSKTVCVFCSSSDYVSTVFFEAARELGTVLGQKKFTLLYGGEDVGLMGAVARSAKREGAPVIGIITDVMRSRESVNFSLCDEIQAVRTFGERKALLLKRADAFLVLPGGYGTLDEMSEMINLKHSGYHDKPIVILNVWGYYDQLEQLFKTLHAERFSEAHAQKLYRFAKTPAQVIELLEGEKA